jgi:hypothetical protein
MVRHVQGELSAEVTVDSLGELLASDHRHTLEFFVVSLKDVSECAVDQDELLYNASVLAHYAQLSTDADSDMATPADLIGVFDHFVSDMSLTDPLLLETAGAQCLFLSGFFEAQMRRRHNIQWYAGLGASFFHRAAAGGTSTKRARLLETIAREFEPWRRRHARLSREMRDWPYLLSR